MASIDEEFRVVVRSAGLEDAFAAQLEHAARVLATSRSVASGITSVRSVGPGQMPRIRDLALRLAERYGLGVTVESNGLCRVRFSRRDASQGATGVAPPRAREPAR
jgi:hypothetical protein